MFYFADDRKMEKQKKSSRAICRTPTTGCRNGWHIVRAITITRREKTKKTFNKSSDRCQTKLPKCGANFK